MSVPILFTVGTPLGQWAGWAALLLGRAAPGKRLSVPEFTAWHTAVLGTGDLLPSVRPGTQNAELDAILPTDASAGPWGGIDARACWTLDRLNERFPDARYLVFIESPAVGLAAALAVDQANDPAQWLAAWRAGAELVLQHAQRDPSRCLLVEADEAQRNPRAFVQACVRRFGLNLPEPTEAPVDPDPLSRALGLALAFADREAQAVFSELRASCMLLADAEPEAFLLGDALRIDGQAAARRLRDLHVAQQAALDTAEQLAALRLRADNQASGLQQQASQLANAVAKLSRADSAVKAAGEESQLLSLQLQQVQEELEHYSQLCGKLEAAAASSVSSGDLLDLSIGEVQPVTERDVPPHRELTFILRQVKLGEREIGEATVRLVEHHGHPGLVVFLGARRSPLLKGLIESGREDGRPYALLVPGDLQSHAMFDAMDRTDWVFTGVLVARFEALLGDASVPVSPRWQPLARRLREALQEMPPRFRFDALVVEPADGTDDGRVAFRFGQVRCGVRELPRLTLIWQPAGPEAGVALLHETDIGPPLSSWPGDGAGSTSPELLRLPLGPGFSDEEMRAQWSQWMPADRDFACALLNAWSAAVSRVAAEVLDAGAGGSAQQLVAAAAALLADAERAMAPPPQPALAPPSGGLLRRTVRRLRHQSAGAGQA